MLVDVVVVLEVVDVVVSGAPGEIGGFPALIAGPSRKVIGIALDLGCLDPSRVSRGFARWTGQVREGRHRSRRAGRPRPAQRPSGFVQVALEANPRVRAVAERLLR